MRSTVAFTNNDVCKLRRYAEVTTSSIAGFLSSIIASDRGIGLSTCPWRLQAKFGQKFEFRLTAYENAALQLGNKPYQQQQANDQLTSGEVARCAWRIFFVEGTKTSERSVCEGSTKDYLVFTSKSHVISIYFTPNIKSDIAPAFILAYKGEQQHLLKLCIFTIVAAAITISYCYYSNSTFYCNLLLL